MNETLPPIVPPANPVTPVPTPLPTAAANPVQNTMSSPISPVGSSVNPAPTGAQTSIPVAQVNRQTMPTNTSMTGPSFPPFSAPKPIMNDNLPPISSQKKLSDNRVFLAVAGISGIVILSLIAFISYYYGQQSINSNQVKPTPTVSIEPTVTVTPSPSAEPTDLVTPSVTESTSPTPTISLSADKEVKQISITWTEPYQGNVLKWNYSLTLPKGTATEAKVETFEANATITLSSGMKLRHRFPAEIVGADKVKKASIVTVGKLSNGRTLYRVISPTFHPDRYRYFDSTGTGCGEQGLEADETCPEWGVIYGAVNANERITDPFIDVPTGSISVSQLKEFDDIMLSIKK